MAIKTFKPYTPSRRFITVEDFSDITHNKPCKSLLRTIRKSGGRNNTGEVMVRFRGGGVKRNYRVVDFKRDKFGVEGVIATVEYDPNRSCRIALVNYKDGEKRYILLPNGMKVGDVVMSGPDAPIKTGNALPLSKIPVGLFVHNIEMQPGIGGKLVRSAGTGAQLMAKENFMATLKMPSGEIRLIRDGCLATIGQVGNLEHENVTLGNAGRKRHLGFRPHVRGTAMNAVDHPHGGGRGRSKGNNHPSSPWGQPAKGYKTKSKKTTDWMIIKRRVKQSEAV